MIASGALPAPLPAHIGVSQTSQQPRNEQGEFSRSLPVGGCTLARLLVTGASRIPCDVRPCIYLHERYAAYDRFSPAEKASVLSIRQRFWQTGSRGCVCRVS
jgi:hypothetical protein